MDKPPDISTNDSIKDTDMNVTDQSGSKSLQSEDDIDVEKVNMVVISSDDEVEIVGVSDQGSKTAPELQNGAEPDGSKSPLSRDTTCSVCLSEFDNKAFLDKCFHAFCYFCILQWSEIVQTCPLCKSGFTSIIHSVKSMDNYQQHYLSNPGVNDPTNQSQSQSAAGRFRYRTTLAEGRRPHQQVPGRQRNQEGASDAWGQRARRREAYLSSLKNRKLMARERRRTVYFYNLWVEQVRQQGRLRHRDISPAFFRANPACSHRLIPWLTRELRVLLNDDENHMNFVLQMVLSLITKIEITSEEFCTQLQPFLFGQTEHFIHEFRSFAQSPFDVTAYDERAQYNWPSESRALRTDTPTVFNSETTGWQTPDTVPGPSGESVQELSRTDWTGENPSWSPNSSPGTSGLNIPSLPRPVVSGSTQTVSIHVDSLTGGNASSSQGGTKSRSVSVGESVVEGSSKESRRKHHHRHRHSKHKHKQKRKDRLNQDPGKCITLEIDADRPGPSHISIDSSTSGNSVDVMTVSSDDVFSPDVLLVKEECSGADVIPTVKTESKAGRSGSVKSRRHKKRPKSSSRCRSRKASHARRDTRSRTRSRSRTKQHVRDDNRSRSRSNTKQRERDENRSRSKTKQHVTVESRSRSRSNTKHHTRGESRSRSNTKHRERSESRSRSSSNTKQHVRGESKSRSRSKTKRHGSRSRTRSQSRSRTNNRVLNGNKSQSRRIQRDHSSSGKEVASKKRSKKPRPEKEQVQAQRSRSRSTSKSSSKQKAVTETPSLDCSTFSKSPSTKSRSPVRHSPSHSRCSRKSQSPSRSSRASRSRSHAKSQSRERSGSRSRVHSLSVTDEATPLSNEDIQKEIGDLEFRIAADKKRLLQLLIKQEKTKGGLDSDRNEDEESVHVVAPEEQETHL